MYIYIYVWVCAWVQYPRMVEWGIQSPETELWTVVSCLVWLLGITLRPLERAVCALSHWAISPVLCLFACLSVCGRATSYIHMRTCGGRRAALGGGVFWHHPLLFIYFILFLFLGQGLPLTWNSPAKLGWLTKKPQESTCLHSSSSGTISAHYHVDPFFVCLFCFLNVSGCGANIFTNWAISQPSTEYLKT